MIFEPYTPKHNKQTEKDPRRITLEQHLAACPPGHKFDVPPEAKICATTIYKWVEKYNKEHGTKFKTKIRGYYISFVVNEGTAE